MMKHILGFFAIILLAACASPTMKMSDADIAAASDDQLCKYKNNYFEEDRLNAELRRRGLGDLECNRFYRECVGRGNQPGTPAMNFCMDLLRENERLRYDPPYDPFIFGYHRPRAGVYIH